MSNHVQRMMSCACCCCICLGDFDFYCLRIWINVKSCTSAQGMASCQFVNTCVKLVIDLFTLKRCLAGLSINIWKVIEKNFFSITPMLDALQYVYQKIKNPKV